MVNAYVFFSGFWCEMLGVGDFYYELGVQVVELCVATSHRNGGILSLDEVLLRLNHRRRMDNQISRFVYIAVNMNRDGNCYLFEL